MVTHQLQARCRPVEVRRSETDVLPLSHQTNQAIMSQNFTPSMVIPLSYSIQYLLSFFTFLGTWLHPSNWSFLFFSVSTFQKLLIFVRTRLYRHPCLGWSAYSTTLQTKHFLQLQIQFNSCPRIFSLPSQFYFIQPFHNIRLLISKCLNTALLHLSAPCKYRFPTKQKYVQDHNIKSHHSQTFPRLIA